MNAYEFTSADGIDVTVEVIGSYRGIDDKDLFVTASNGFEREFEECGDGEDVIEALEESGILFDENPRHFAAFVISACLIVGDCSLEEALDFQAEWEARRA